MKRLLTALLAMLLILSLLPASAASKRPPKLHLMHMAPGDSSQPIEGEGTWESQHPDIASAQKAMASRIERTYHPGPQGAAAFESLYQRYRHWCAQAEPLYAPDAPGL